LGISKICKFCGKKIFFGMINGYGKFYDDSFFIQYHKCPRLSR